MSITFVGATCSIYFIAELRTCTQTRFTSKGGRVVVIANNAKLPITNIGESVIIPRLRPQQVQL